MGKFHPKFGWKLAINTTQKHNKKNNQRATSK